MVDGRKDPGHLFGVYAENRFPLCVAPSSNLLVNNDFELLEKLVGTLKMEIVPIPADFIYL